MRTAIVVAVLCLPFLAFAQPGQNAKEPCEIVYVPTEQVVVEKMLQMAQVNKNDIVFDLGCGDGRIVVTAARKFGCQGIGIDIDPARIKDSLATMRKAGVTKQQVEIRQGDALKVKDLEKATVIMLYMLPQFMEKLEPQIKKRLKPGTRVVAHDYPFPNLDPDQIVEFAVKGSPRPKFLYLWTIRGKKK
ncbi:MAG: methyltransferase domain-containing protein [Planctomycetes bacterium]|nr:methyltransferase domain-containing protein [Planctomycetota bacterium]